MFGLSTGVVGTAIRYSNDPDELINLNEGVIRAFGLTANR
jgi:hypothetical protein